MEAARYQVREVEGFRGSFGGGTAKRGVDVMVLDSAYAWAVVAYFGAPRNSHGQTLAVRRERAAAFAARRNAE